MFLVSVILPSFHSQRWVGQAIESVLSQTHRNLELILVDDGSEDQTLEILNKYLHDERVNLIALKGQSGGPAVPRNRGLEIANGDFIAFLDSDDIWHPQKLSIQLELMTSGELNFSSSKAIRFIGEAPKASSTSHSNVTITRKNHAQLIRKNWVTTSSALIKRSLFDGINFNQSSDYIGIEDYLTWLMIHQRADIKSAVINAPLVFYRLRSDSLSHSKIDMAKKIFTLLRNYQYRGKPLGARAYYYFATYALISLLTRLKS